MLKFKIKSQRLEFKNIRVLNKFDMRCHEFILFKTYIRVHVYVRGAVTKFPELWYSTVMVGYMTKLT